MKKIIFFDFSTLNYGGGCEVNFMNLGRWFSARGHDTGYVTATQGLNNLYCTIFRRGKHKKNISDEDLINSFNVTNYLTFSFVDLFFRTASRRRINSALKDADVIYSKNEIFEVLLLKYFFRIDFHKVIFGFHTALIYPQAKTFFSKLHNMLYGSRFYSNLVKGSKIRILVLNKSGRELLARRGYKNITVIPNPLDTIKFSLKPESSHSIFKIYYVGRMTEPKGIDTLVQTVEELSMSNVFSKMEFYFIGEGPKSNDLQDLERKFSNCHFLGFRTEMVNHYHHADLVVVPSHWETFCYSAAEAQACGVPVVASDIPGPRDIIHPGKTGWLVRTKNANEFASAILRAYQLWTTNSREYRQMGIEARRNILTNFEITNVVQKLENLFFRSE